MPLTSRSSAPAEVSAEFFAGVAPCTRKLVPGSASNVGMRFGSVIQSAEQDRLIEARAQLAPGVARVMGVVSEPEAAAGYVGLAIRRRVKALRLHGGVRRNGRDWVRNAIARLGTAAEALGIELRLQGSVNKGGLQVQHCYPHPGKIGAQPSRATDVASGALMPGSAAAEAAECLGQYPEGD
jgi:hypothetical protein